jgi:hypothetical protein
MNKHNACKYSPIILVLILFIGIVGISACAAQPTVTVTVAPPQTPTQMPTTTIPRPMPTSTPVPVQSTNTEPTSTSVAPITGTLGTPNATTISTMLPLSDSFSISPNGFYVSKAFFLGQNDFIDIVLNSQYPISSRASFLPGSYFTGGIDLDLKFVNIGSGFPQSSGLSFKTYSSKRSGNSWVTDIIVGNVDPVGYYALSLYNETGNSCWCQMTINLTSVNAFTTPAYTTPPPASSSNGPVIVAQLPLSDSVILAPLDMTAQQKLMQQQSMGHAPPNPPFNLYGWHASQVFSLIRETPATITLEANCPILYRDTGPSDTDFTSGEVAIVAAITPVSKDDPMGSQGTYDAVRTKSITGNGTNRVTVVYGLNSIDISPHYFMLNLTNTDITNPHSCQYTIKLAGQ